MTVAPPPPSAPPVEPLRSAVDAGVATLTLASPKDRNALSLQMINLLTVTLADLAEDKRVRVIVLTAEGPAFSGGHNLKEMQAHRNDPDRGEEFFDHLFARCATLMQAIVALPKPVIAAIEGVATAGGCQLAASCDLVVAGEKAQFGLSGVNAGLFCSTPLVAVGRAVSRKAALELALTGDLIGAEDALRIGLVNRVVPAGRALDAALALARRIAEHSAASIAMGKRTFHAQIGEPLDVAYALASKTMVENLAEADCVEGMAAFIEKRKPRYAP